MNSDQLIKFKTIVECGTVSQAAEKLFVSQPALSYTIATLEKETQCVLFLREKNKLVLTPDGQELMQYAVQVADALNRADLAMRNRFKITLSANNIAATMLLSCYPENQLDQIRLILAGEEEFPKLILNGTLDAAACDDFYMKDIVHNHPEVEIEKHPVFEEFLGLLVPWGHKLYDRETLTYEDLIGVSLCVQADASSLMLWLKNIETITGIPFCLDYPFDHITLENVRHKLSCAEIRRGSTTVSSPDRAKQVRLGYHFIPLEDVYSRREVSLWYLKEKRRKIKPLLNSLEQFLREKEA